MTNYLASEKSPYLQQHAHNPVGWYPWGKAAFDAALRENKPILLSVGYSTCHWCHVMEAESFTDTEVAKVLNETFISIKVDREERPDVDAIYMEAVQAMTGSGGWPMTVFMTPKGEPFFGGTYFPKQRFLEIVTRTHQLWHENSTLLVNEGKKLFDWLNNRQTTRIQGELTPALFNKFAEGFLRSFDPENGGRQGAPKFPPSYSLRLLLRIGAGLPEVEKTLNSMARGGIYDHLGGGFHRYSTDEKWLVPHFEKMLYDQAALLHAYVEAYQATREREYELVAREIADYVLRDMTSPEGAFYTAEDADSEGVEGKFYVWTEQELKQALTHDQYAEFTQAFPITTEGNFEHQWNVLELKGTRKDRPESLKHTMRHLFDLRSKRIKPLRDEKILTSWNGLFISALAKAGAAFSEPSYKAAAVRAARFVLGKCRIANEDGLTRRWMDGESKFSACLEDYAFIIDAMIELHQATLNPEWLKEARLLQTLQDKLFLNQESGAYFMAQAGVEDQPHTLPHRKTEYEDGVIPAGNSISLLNHLRLSLLEGKSDFAVGVQKFLENLPALVTQYPNGFSQLMMGIHFLQARPIEVKVRMGHSPLAGSVDQMLGEIHKQFVPHKIVSLESLDGNPLTTIQICRDQVCQAPTSKVPDLRQV